MKSKFWIASGFCVATMLYAQDAQKTGDEEARSQHEALKAASAKQ